MPPRSKPTTAEIFDLLIEKSEELRKAGVSELELGEMRVTFAPFIDLEALQQPRQFTDADDPELEQLMRSKRSPASDPLNDPDTYGTDKVPIVRRRRARLDEDLDA